MIEGEISFEEHNDTERFKRLMTCETFPEECAGGVPHGHGTDAPGVSQEAYDEAIAIANKHAAVPVPTKQRPEDQRLPDGLVTEDDFVVLAANLEARRQIGIQRYGQAHVPFNGRDTFLDAYEELLDMLIYMTSLRRMQAADREKLIEVVAAAMKSEVPEIGDALARRGERLAEVAVDRIMGWVSSQS